MMHVHKAIVALQKKIGYNKLDFVLKDLVSNPFADI